MNWIFLFILTLFNSISPSPSIYFANSPLSLLSFSYVSYDSDKRSQEEDRIPNELDYKYMVTSTRRKSTCSGHPDALQHPDSEAPRTGPPPCQGHSTLPLPTCSELSAVRATLPFHYQRALSRPPAD